MKKYWFENDPREIYWVEAYKGAWKEFGKELRCPVTSNRRYRPSDEPAPQPDGHFTLMRTVKPGHIVLHYSNDAKAFVGASVVKAEATQETIVWRDGKKRFGWWIPLERFTAAEPLVPLSYLQTESFRSSMERWERKKLKEIERRIIRGEDDLRTQTFYSFRTFGKYYSGSKVHVDNNYLSKLPAALLMRLPRLLSLADSADSV